jgi:hypothetical protein
LLINVTFLSCVGTRRWKQVADFKGTGTRDENWLKVVWYDGSWLGESPADIQKIVNCPFNFILNYQILICLAQKAFEFAKSF